MDFRYLCPASSLCLAAAILEEKLCKVRNNVHNGRLLVRCRERSVLDFVSLGFLSTELEMDPT